MDVLMTDLGTVDTPLLARMIKFPALPRFTAAGPRAALLAGTAIADTPLEMAYLAVIHNCLAKMVRQRWLTRRPRAMMDLKEDMMSLKIWEGDSTESELMETLRADPHLL